MTFRLLLALALVAVGCGRVDVDTSGLPCPCSDGNECDPVCNVCVPPGTPEGVSCSECKILFRDFRADWVTPNSIGWRWKVLDENGGDSFGSYTLTLAAKEQAPRVYDSSTNPELGLFSLPNAGKDIVQTTITDGLDPGIAYTGTLTARDELNCEFVTTSVARPTTSQPTSVSIELFGETSTGFIAGQDGTIVNTDCKVLPTCLQTLMPACVLPPNESTCSSLLKYAGLDIEITEDNLSEGEFEDAYLEVWTKNTGPAPAWYSWVWLRTQADQYWQYVAITLPNDPDYKRVQIPLRELVLKDDLLLKDESVKLDHSNLVQDGIKEVTLGTLIEPTSTVVLADEIYIRR